MILLIGSSYGKTKLVDCLGVAMKSAIGPREPISISSFNPILYHISYFIKSVLKMFLFIILFAQYKINFTQFMMFNLFTIMNKLPSYPW